MLKNDAAHPLNKSPAVWYAVLSIPAKKTRSASEFTYTKATYSGRFKTALVIIFPQPLNILPGTSLSVSAKVGMVGNKRLLCTALRKGITCWRRILTGFWPRRTTMEQLLQTRFELGQRGIARISRTARAARGVGSAEICPVVSYGN